MAACYIITMQTPRISCILGILLFGLTVHAHGGEIIDHPLFAKHKQEQAKVVRVLSADTIRLEDDRTVVLIGLRAPEAPAPEKIERDQYGFVIESDIPYLSIEEQTMRFVQDLLEGQTILLEYDIEKISADGTIQGYAFLKDGTFVNAEILRQGFSDLRIQPPNLKYASQLREAYRQARQEKRGIHGE